MIIVVKQLFGLELGFAYKQLTYTYMTDDNAFYNWVMTSNPQFASHNPKIFFKFSLFTARVLYEQRNAIIQ